MAGAELVIVSGIDSAEIARVIPGDAQVLEVEPWHLGLMAHHWPAPEPEPSGSANGTGLVGELADLVAAERADGSIPLHPARAVIDVVEVLGPDSLVVVDPGPAALWLGRGLVSTQAGQIVIPGLPVKGFAAAAALIAGLDGRAALAIATAPTDAKTDELLDLAAGLDIALTLEVWGADAAWEDASEHRSRLVGAMAEGGVSVLGAPVDFAATRELVEIAGPIEAWMPSDETGGGGFDSGFN